MREVLALDNFSLLHQGATLSMSLMPGQTLGVTGPAASGKTTFLRVIAGSERAAQGAVRIAGSVDVAGRAAFTRRSTPQALVRQALGRKKADAGDVLTALGLWDHRLKKMTELTPGQAYACELFPCFCGDGKVVLIDGQLDRLDPWALKGAADLLRSRTARGASAIVATNRPDLLCRFDSMLVLDRKRVAYSGTVKELTSQGRRSEVEIQAESQAGVKALVEPFGIRVESQANGVVLHAKDGQELAARLLLEGYGDVKFIVVREPTLEQSLLHLAR